jgi:hypothetical protein
MDGVVRTLKPHHVKGEGLLAEIVQHDEPDWQIDVPEGLDALSWRDTREQRRAGLQLVQPDPHQP